MSEGEGRGLVGRVPGAGTRLGRFSLFFVLACILLVVAVGTLAVLQYRSRVEVEGLKFREMAQEAEQRSTAISYFFAERRGDLVDLAKAREVSLYFENAALGMSPEYGLRASLLEAEAHFDGLRATKTLAGAPVFSRIVLVDDRGEPLAGSGPEPWSHGDEELRRRLLSVDRFTYFSTTEKGQVFVVASVPVDFKGRHVGHLIAWMPLAVPYRALVGEDRVPAPTAVALGSAWVHFPESARSFVSAQHQASSPPVPPGQATPFQAPRRGTTAYSVVRVPVAETPFDLVTFYPSVDRWVFSSAGNLFLSTAGLVAVILFGIVLVILLNTRNSVLRTRLEETTRREREVGEKNRQLTNEVSERRKAEEALRASEEHVRALNVELERRVEQRTAQLLAANQQLEAFSYSVSHDLRSPLRAIDGFSAILVETQGERLDDEGRRLLGVVRSNARKMGALIRDLLAFSRVGRSEARQKLVDMSAAAREAAAECLGDGPARDRVALSVEDLPPALCDEALIRQVWANLVSNAIKFSSRVDSPVVEVTGRREGDFLVYSVRDNGAGFDMAHADQLFGVFRRLHAADQFEGTGVGLAIVHRIVTRHGGRTWAEAAVGKGATFSFSLPVTGSE